MATAKTPTKASTYKAFLKANPKATFEEFNKATGGAKQKYYQTRYDLRLTKKIAVKPAKKKPIVLGNVGTEPSQYTLLHRRIAQLENDNRSLRVIISYLEHQLKLNQSATAI